jgi:hypothetical protein
MRGDKMSNASVRKAEHGSISDAQKKDYLVKEIVRAFTQSGFDDNDPIYSHRDRVGKSIDMVFAGKVSVEELRNTVINEFNKNYLRALRESMYGLSAGLYTTTGAVLDPYIDVNYHGSYRALRDSLDRLDSEGLARLYESIMEEEDKFNKEEKAFMESKHPYISKILLFLRE